jgi:hypothetical protein
LASSRIGQFTRGDLLLGAAARLCEKIGVAVSSAEHYFRERAIESATADLSEQEIRTGLEAGAAFGLAEAAEPAKETLARVVGRNRGTPGLAVSLQSGSLRYPRRTE